MVIASLTTQKMVLFLHLQRKIESLPVMLRYAGRLDTWPRCEIEFLHSVNEWGSFEGMPLKHEGPEFETPHIALLSIIPFLSSTRPLLLYPANESFHEQNAGG